MSKYTTQQIERRARAMESLDMETADMLREYAAHLSRHSEGASEETPTSEQWRAMPMEYDGGIQGDDDDWIIADSNGGIAWSVSKQNAQHIVKLHNERAALTDVWHNRPEPDAFCVSTEDGGCVSDDPRCMHNRPAQEKGEPVACRFCGHEGPFDLWPCEWLDGSGANAVRCPMCHGAAPEATWNRTATPAERVRVPDGWKLVPIEPTPKQLCDMAEAFNPANYPFNAMRGAYVAALSAAPEADHD